MANVSLSGDEKSIESILSWYDDQLKAIKDFKKKIIDSVISSKPVGHKFIAFTLDELDEYFNDSEDELEHLVCFNILSATEAKLRLDFFNRVSRKDKSPIGKTFREFNKKWGNRISLEEHILETWKKETGENVFSDFSGILKYRHWLAHGRYWNPKLGREYSINDAKTISTKIFAVIAGK